MTEAQFNEEILPLYNKMYRYALAILKEESDASDCLQETFIKLWENRHRLMEIENKTAYCLISVKRAAIDHLRYQKQTTREGIFPSTLSSQQSPEVISEHRDSLSLASRLLHSLPEQQRKVVEMSAFKGLSNSEIKELTGLSDDNVRVVLSRGRKKLKELFTSFTK